MCAVPAGLSGAACKPVMHGRRPCKPLAAHSLADAREFCNCVRTHLAPAAMQELSLRRSSGLLLPMQPLQAQQGWAQFACPSFAALTWLPLLTWVCQGYRPPVAFPGLQPCQPLTLQLGCPVAWSPCRCVSAAAPVKGLSWRWQTIGGCVSRALARHFAGHNWGRWVQRQHLLQAVTLADARCRQTEAFWGPAHAGVA